MLLHSLHVAVCAGPAEAHICLQPARINPRSAENVHKLCAAVPHQHGPIVPAGKVCQAEAAPAGAQWRHTQSAGAADWVLHPGPGEHGVSHGALRWPQAGDGAMCWGYVEVQQLGHCFPQVPLLCHERWAPAEGYGAIRQPPPSDLMSVLKTV